MTTETIATRKHQLRQKLRQRRRSLGSREQAAAGRSLRDRLLCNSHFRHSRHIACYLPADGEIDTRPLIKASLAAGKRLYLPVIDSGRMIFHPYARSTRLQRNQFGLWQPRPDRQATPVKNLDLVLLPLVGFDRSGARLGMGGGFYDRAFRYACRRSPRPFLMGVAHAIQELESVPVEGWDRDLYAIATDRDYFTVASGTSRHRLGNDTGVQG